MQHFLLASPTIFSEQFSPSLRISLSFHSIHAVLHVMSLEMLFLNFFLILPRLVLLIKFQYAVQVDQDNYEIVIYKNEYKSLNGLFEL